MGGKLLVKVSYLGTIVFSNASVQCKKQELEIGLILMNIKGPNHIPQPSDTIGGKQHNIGIIHAKYPYPP